MAFDVTAALFGMMQPQMFSVPSDQPTEPSDREGWPQEPELISREIVACILPFTDQELRFMPQGTYTSEDVQVFLIGEMLPHGTTFEWRGFVYEIDRVEDHLQYGGYARHLAVRRRHLGGGAHG